MNEVFIDKGPVVLRGEDARTRLRVTNDSSFLVEGRGIPRVDKARWEVARAAEDLHWFDSDGSGRRIADDRNLVHYWRFAGYEVLRGMQFSHALEVGCGPFTNLRLIGNECSVESCTLLDPAIDKYLSHGRSYYTTEYLATVPASRTRARLWNLAGPIPRALAGLSASRIAIRSIIASGAETLRGVEADLVIMVNVLEHCMDADEIVRRVWDCVVPGGILVLGDKVHDDLAVRESAIRVYDSAHPLRITISVMR